MNENKKSMRDMSCLAEGKVVPTDFGRTGLNANELVVGGTGSGKSVSNAYSRILHTYDSSIVVPISKRKLKDQFAGLLKERGYEVLDLNFAHPEECDTGYDPMDYIHSDEDVVQTARNLIGLTPSQRKTGEIDPYWNDSATSVLAAEISLVMLNAKSAGKSPCFGEVIDLHRAMKRDKDEDLFTTNLDFLFEKAEQEYPGNQASELWKTVQDLAPRTASCIISIVNNALDKIFSGSVIQMSRKEKRVDFHLLGKRRTALFITTSPMNKSLQNLVNLMYSDMFRTLFETAENNKTYQLDIPVHIICDDFACGSRIYDFEEYISIFRAAGISVSLLLQSESQLISMYGEEAATTIINNCDTYIYMGGMDLTTCEHISKRLNKPVHAILNMPLEQVMVFRRGSEPFVGRRYQTFGDPMYQEITQTNKGREDH